MARDYQKPLTPSRLSTTFLDTITGIRDRRSKETADQKIADENKRRFDIGQERIDEQNAESLRRFNISDERLNRAEDVADEKRAAEFATNEASRFTLDPKRYTGDQLSKEKKGIAESRAGLIESGATEDEIVNFDRMIESQYGSGDKLFKRRQSELGEETFGRKGVDATKIQNVRDKIASEKRAEEKADLDEQKFNLNKRLTNAQIAKLNRPTVTKKNNQVFYDKTGKPYTIDVDNPEHMKVARDAGLIDKTTYSKTKTGSKKNSSASAEIKAYQDIKDDASGNYSWGLGTKDDKEALDTIDNLQAHGIPSSVAKDIIRKVEVDDTIITGKGLGKDELNKFGPKVIGKSGKLIKLGNAIEAAEKEGRRIILKDGVLTLSMPKTSSDIGENEDSTSVKTDNVVTPAVRPVVEKEKQIFGRPRGMEPTREEILSTIRTKQRNNQKLTRQEEYFLSLIE